MNMTENGEKKRSDGRHDWRVRCFLPVSALALMAGDPSAAAQDAAGRKLSVQDVVVTATKRKENLRKVPQSITAVTATQLRDQQIASFDDLSRAIPDMTNTDFNARAGNGNFALRGIAASAPTGSFGQQTVGIYLDDVNMTMPTGASNGAATPAFFDVAQVEVLRGPQGTLYGASSMGGTIRTISNQPNLTKQQYSFRAGMSSIETGGFGWTGEAIGNIPIIDNVLAIRAGIHATHSPGYIDRIDGNTGAETHGYNNSSQTVGKVAIRYQPDSSFTITPDIFYQRTRSDGDNGYLDGTNNKVVRYVDTPGVDKITAPSLTISKDFGFATLTSASAYMQRKFTQIDDETLGGLGFDTTPEITQGFSVPSNVYRFSEELRLVSAPIEQSPMHISYVLGGYYSNERIQSGNYEYFTQDHSTVDSLLAQSPVYSYNGYDSAQDMLDGIKADNYDIYTQLGYAHTKQYSIFGELNYQPFPKLTATFGFRYLTAKLTSTMSIDGFYAYTANDVANTWSGTENNHAFTPKFSARYDLNSDASVYATVVNGFRLGGINEPVATGLQACADALAQIGLKQSADTYQPDSVWSYEVVEKSSLLDHRISTDVSVYRIDWSKVQQDIALYNLNPSCPDDFTANEGRAQVNGLDAAFTGRVSEELTARLAGSFTDAELTQVGAGAVGEKGNWLANIPRWNLSYGLGYNPEFTAAYDGFVNLDVRMVGPARSSIESEGDLASEAGYYVPSYTTADASFGFTLQGYRTSFWVKNLANNQKVINVSTMAPVTDTRLAPRTFGIDVSKSF